MLRISMWTPTSCSNEWDACQDLDASQGHRAQDRGQVDVGEKRQGGTWVSHVPQTLCQPPEAYSHKCDTHDHSYRRYIELVYMKRAFKVCLATSADSLSLLSNFELSELNKKPLFVSHEIWCFRKYVDSWDRSLSQIIILWITQYFFSDVT